MIKSPFEDIQFPQYRKYSSDKNYFKILSSLEFEEVQVIGSKKIKRMVVAHQFPEKNFILDLLQAKTEHIVVISESDYQLAT